MYQFPSAQYAYRTASVTEIGDETRNITMRQLGGVLKRFPAITKTPNFSFLSNVRSEKPQDHVNPSRSMRSCHSGILALGITVILASSDLAAQAKAIVSTSDDSNAVTSQAAPPPVQPPVRTVPARIIGVIPTSSQIMYRLRTNVQIDVEEGVEFERALNDNLTKQRAILRSYGIDPDASLPPGFRLNRSDARALNSALDDLEDELEDSAEEILSSRARSEFRDILRRASQDRTRAINAMKR